MITKKKNRINFRVILPTMWAYRTSIGWILILLSLATFTTLPLTCQRASADEKAMIVGTMGLSIADLALGAISLADRASRKLSNPPNIYQLIETVNEIALATPDSRLPPPPRWHHSNTSSSVHTIIHGGRGDGTESLLLVLPLHSTPTAPPFLTAAIGIQVARHLALAPWLAKTLAIVFVDDGADKTVNKNTTTNTLQQWLVSPVATSTLGTLQQAFILDIQSPRANAAFIDVHGYHGQLPNLDMVVLAKKNIDFFGGGLPVGVAVGRRFFSTPVKPGIKPSYVDRLKTITAFTLQSALGNSWGDRGGHGVVLWHRHADALTLILRHDPRLVVVLPPPHNGGSGGGSATINNQQQQQFDGMSTARAALSIAEMVLRTCNNLHERFHHATALYVLADAEHYVNIGAYMVPPALLLAALALYVCSCVGPYPIWWEACAALVGIVGIVGIGVGSGGSVPFIMKAMGALGVIVAAVALQLAPPLRSLVLTTSEEQQQGSRIQSVLNGIALLVLITCTATLLWNWALTFLALISAVLALYTATALFVLPYSFTNTKVPKNE